jgi:aspartyl/asparaginyl beta-hydroxylase (cupin superfamily)
MPGSDFDWSRPYVVPTSLRFRPTPSGGLQLDGGGTEESVEVQRDWAPLVLAFARSQTPEEAYEAATEEWEVDRESFQQILGTLIEKGLLRPYEAGPTAPSRLALFQRAQEAGAPPLRSHFPLQKPPEFYPGLETREIHDRERFPWVATLEEAFPVIREEFDRLLGSASFSTVYRGQTTTGEWAGSYLWVFGEKVEETCRLCPETARLLAAIPGVAEYGTTLYSGLAPHTFIAPHYGYTNAKLRCQLPLRVPGRCRLKVGDLEIEQREGRCIVFDDSFLHSAWNDSGEPRFVIVFDFFHPDLTPEEIDYLLRLARERKLAKAVFHQAKGGERVDWAGARAPDAREA